MLGGDPRIKDVVQSFTDGYRLKYKIPYPISWSKDQKLAQRLLHYMDGFCEPGDVVPKIQSMIRAYFATNGYVAQNRHSFGVFCSSPFKWVEVTPEPEIKKAQSIVRTWFDVDLWLPRESIETAESLFKKWALGAPIQKCSNPKEYEKVKKAFVEKLGKERCIELWKTKKLQTEN